MDATSVKLWRKYFAPIANNIIKFHTTRQQYMVAVLNNGNEIKFSVNAEKQFLLGIYDDWLFVDDYIKQFKYFAISLCKDEDEDECYFRLLMHMFNEKDDYLLNMNIEKLINISLDNIRKADKELYMQYMKEYCQKLK